jgi:hypothetical protein
VLENVDLTALIPADYNPLKDEQCRRCIVQPICKGYCQWSRALFDDACHLIKYAIDDYVRAYRSCFDVADGAVVSLVAPLDIEEFYSSQLDPANRNKPYFAGMADYSRPSYQNPGS